MGHIVKAYQFKLSESENLMKPIATMKALGVLEGNKGSIKSIRFR